MSPAAPKWMTGEVLLAIAAPGEARAVLTALGAPVELADRAWVIHRVGDRVEMVVTGVGKANAAGAVARLAEPARHGLIVSAGVGGSLPSGAGGGHLPVGSAVVATRSVFADEGVWTPEGFVEIAARGFAPGPWAGNGVDAAPRAVAELRGLVEASGPVATVSSCSGTTEAGRLVAARTGAVAEGMEGAAVAGSAARLGVASVELRVISNRCDDRPEWDLPRALERLGELLARALG